MIEFANCSEEIPYLRFKKEYDLAISANQKNIEALSISSYSKDLSEVNSRFVNLKIIDNLDFIFFSNYNSPKAVEFCSHEQISATFFWPSTNVQIRMKALIKKTSIKYNQEYFQKRSSKKNALAISSDQSKPIDSFESVMGNFKSSLGSDNLQKCPDYWGGFYFTPYYIEFWKGHESRLNRRDSFYINKGEWNHSVLQP